MTELEKAQLAMAIDCEGCIHISPTLFKKHWSFSAKMFISNTNLDFLNWIKATVGLGEIKQTHRAPTYMGIGLTDNWKPIYMWVVYSKNMKVILPIIEPYLIIKKDIAKLAIEFLGSCNGKGYHVPEEKEKRRLEIFTELKRLNWRGTKPFTPFNFNRTSPLSI